MPDIFQKAGYKVIYADNPVIFLQEIIANMAANKTRTAGYNYHINTLLFLLFS